MNAISGIYYIENIVNHKKYFGLSKNIEKRFLGHYNQLQKGKHNKSLQEDFDKYGIDNFNFYIIEKIHSYNFKTIREFDLYLHYREKIHIEKNKSHINGYNRNKANKINMDLIDTEKILYEEVNIKIDFINYMKRKEEIANAVSLYFKINPNMDCGIKFRTKAYDIITSYITKHKMPYMEVIKCIESQPMTKIPIWDQFFNYWFKNKNNNEDKKEEKKSHYKSSIEDSTDVNDWL